MNIIAPKVQSRFRFVAKGPRCALTAGQVAEAFGALELDVSTGDDTSPLALRTIWPQVEAAMRAGDEPSAHIRSECDKVIVEQVTAELIADIRHTDML